MKGNNFIHFSFPSVTPKYMELSCWWYYSYLNYHSINFSFKDL